MEERTYKEAVQTLLKEIENSRRKVLRTQMMALTVVTVIRAGISILGGAVGAYVYHLLTT